MNTTAAVADRMEDIAREICNQHIAAMRKEIAKRMKKEFGKRAKCVTPKRDLPYAKSWGPKVLDFPNCDPSIIQYDYVLPLLNLEVARE